MSEGKLYQTEKRTLFREPNSMALINKDRRSLELYKKQRDAGLKERAKAQQLQNDVEQLKSDIGEIKDLLRNIARG